MAGSSGDPPWGSKHTADTHLVGKDFPSSERPADWEVLDCVHRPNSRFLCAGGESELDISVSLYMEERRRSCWGIAFALRAKCGPSVWGAEQLLPSIETSVFVLFCRL